MVQASSDLRRANLAAFARRRSPEGSSASVASNSGDLGARPHDAWGALCWDFLNSKAGVGTRLSGASDHGSIAPIICGRPRRNG